MADLLVTVTQTEEQQKIVRPASGNGHHAETVTRVISNEGHQGPTSPTSAQDDRAGSLEKYNCLRRYFTVKHCLLDSRANYAKMFLIADKTGRLGKDEIVSRLENMTDESRRAGFCPGYDWLLEMRLLHFLSLEPKLIKPAIRATLDSITKITGGRTAQTWLSAWTSLNKEDDKTLRTFLVTLTRELFIAYQTRVTVETVKANLLCLTFVAYIVITSLCLAGFLYHWDYKVLFLLFGCGVSGAWLSVYQRLSKLDESGVDIRQLTAFMNAPHGLIVSLMFGMVAPILAVLFISSGVIHSSFFPKIDSMDFLTQSYQQFKSDFSMNAASELRHYVQTLPTLPAARTGDAATQAQDQKVDSNEIVSAFQNSLDRTPAEAFERLASLKFERTFAKLLLIAFVCGFAERIIHDAIASVLKRFSKQATDQPAQAEETN